MFHFSVACLCCFVTLSSTFLCSNISIYPRTSQSVDHYVAREKLKKRDKQLTESQSKEVLWSCVFLHKDLFDRSASHDTTHTLESLFSISNLEWIINHRRSVFYLVWYYCLDCFGVSWNSKCRYSFILSLFDILLHVRCSLSVLLLYSNPTNH